MSKKKFRFPQDLRETDIRGYNRPAGRRDIMTTRYSIALSYDAEGNIQTVTLLDKETNKSKILTLSYDAEGNITGIDEEWV